MFRKLLETINLYKSYEFASENWHNFLINRLCEGVMDILYAVGSIIFACVLICIMQKTGILHIG